MAISNINLISNRFDKNRVLGPKVNPLGVNKPIAGLVRQEKIAETFFPNVTPRKVGDVLVYDARIRKITYQDPDKKKGEVLKGKEAENATGGFGVEVLWKKGYTFEVYLTDDGGALLDEISRIKSKVVCNKKLIQLFIETDDDLITGRVLQTIFCDDVIGENLRLKEIIPDETKLSSSEMKKLLAPLTGGSGDFFKIFNEIIMGALKVAQVSFKLLATGIGYVIKGIEFLRIDDKTWNFKDRKSKAKEKEDYKIIEEMDSIIVNTINQIENYTTLIGEKYFKKHKGALAPLLSRLGESLNRYKPLLHSFYNFFKEVANGVKDDFKKIFAFLCGLWNGILDIFIGVFFVIELVFKALGGLFKATHYLAQNGARILEELDNIYNSLAQIEWKEVFNSIKNNTIEFFLNFFVNWVNNLDKEKEKKGKDNKNNAGLISKIGNELSKLSAYEWAYYFGYGISFLIPTGAIAKLLGKAGKAGELVGKVMLKIEDFLAAAFKIVLKPGVSILEKLLEFLKAITAKLRAGTKSVIEVVEAIFAQLKRKMEEVMGKVGEVGVIIIDNAIMKVERVRRKVNEKLIEFFLVTYKKTSDGAYLKVLPIDTFLKYFEKAITYTTRKNLRSFEDEGLEFAEDSGIFNILYDGEFVSLGNIEHTAGELNALFEKVTTTKNAKKVLDDWIELVRLRRKALIDLTTEIGEKDIDGLRVHINGYVDLVVEGYNFKGQPIYTGKGEGIHNFYEIIKKRVRYRGGKDTIPPNPKTNEPFLAFVQVYSDITKQWYNKGNSSLKIPETGKGDRSLTSMFPMNWNEQRIMEEIAFAWKNMIYVGNKIGDKGELIEFFKGKSTSGFDIELIFTDNVITTAAPKIII